MRVSGKETSWSETWRSWKIGCVGDSRSEVNAKEVLLPQNGEHFKFPIADGTVKLSGRDQVFPRFTSRRVGGSRPLDTQTDDREARNDFWTIAENLLLKTCRDCISSARKSHQVYSLAGYALHAGVNR